MLAEQQNNSSRNVSILILTCPFFSYVFNILKLKNRTAKNGERFIFSRQEEKGGKGMETSILKLNHYTDEATKEMLQKVVEKKRKFEVLHKRHLLVMWLTILFAFCYFLFLYKHVAIPYAHSMERMFSAFVEESFNLYAMTVIIGSFGFMNVLKQKTDKAEKEFHALRCEIIDKSKDLWKKEEEWKNRHQVFEMMKKEYDINLFYESK